MGLEFLADSHFPWKDMSADVRVGKSIQGGQPSATNTILSCLSPYEVWHMDTIGPTKTPSVHDIAIIRLSSGYSGYNLWYDQVSRLLVQSFRNDVMQILSYFRS